MTRPCAVIVSYGPEGEGFPEHLCGRLPIRATWRRGRQAVPMCALHDTRAQRAVRLKLDGTEGWSRMTASGAEAVV